MIADLHAHYPMRVLTDMDPDTAAKAMKARGGATFSDRFKAFVLRIANKIGNHESWELGHRPGAQRRGRMSSRRHARRNRIQLREAAARGVGYVTVAHLFFRQVATNANALPFAPDFLYDFFFPQRGKDRLTVRGEALIRGLVRNRIMIDLSHMDPPAIRETSALLDEVDPQSEVPVISTHAGFRFGRQEYMHDEGILLQLKRRRGVVGLIMAQHQLNDGLRDEETKTLEESIEVICAHIDEIAKITGGYEQIALGTDFDGFIKPTMGGLEDAGDLALLEAALIDRYGEENAERMTWTNALGVLQRIWPKAA
ncbi:MAG TPA: membrane dipeptidase [Solirubrobacterales bacterium]|nr:membrane dipeptidase [Solirubrobacterales bacterium]